MFVPTPPPSPKVIIQSQACDLKRPSHTIQQCQNVAWESSAAIYSKSGYISSYKMIDRLNNVN